MKKLFAMLVLLFSTIAFANNVTGIIADATGHPVANGTVTFTLQQAAVKAGSFLIVPTTVSCYTTTDGNMVGLPNPKIVAPFSTTTAAGSIPAGTYFLAIAYYDSLGNTSLPSPTNTVSLSGTGQITAVQPALQPANAIGYKVYVGTASNNLILQATTPFGTNTVMNTITGSGVNPSVTNTSQCSITFSDAMIPTNNSYVTNVVDTNGNPVAGFPQTYMFLGASVDISTLTPVSNTQLIFPFPIIANPNVGQTQFLSGALDLNGNTMNAGSYNFGGVAPTGTSGGLVRANGATLTSPTFTGSLSLSSPTITTPAVTGGTFSSPAVTGGTFSSPSLTTPTIGAATGISLSLSQLSSSGAGGLVASVPSFIDMSSGTQGQGGMVQSTNDATNVTGYGLWITNNAYWNATNWIQPRGTLASTGFTANFHKGFSFNRAAATGTNGSTFTWSEVANIDSTGLLTLGSVARTATGTPGAPAYSFTLETNSGWFRQQAGILGFAIGGNYLTQFSATRIGNAPGISLGWASGVPNSFSDDVNISRISAGVLGVGSGAAGSVAGLLKAATTQLSDGATATPAYSFIAEGSTGFYRSGAGQITAAVAGAVGPSFKAAGIQLGSDTQFYSLGAAGDTSLSRSAAGTVAIGTGTSGSTAGTLKAARISATRYAAYFAGADCGAKINAAVTDLATAAGEIWVDQNCGTTISTAVTLAANQTLRFMQGGTYTASAAITLGQGSALIGPGCGGNLCSTQIQEATASNLPSLVNMGNQSTVAGLALDGNKANNPTGGVGLKLSLVQQTKVKNALIQNFKSMGVNIASTLSGDEAASPVFDDVLIFNNDGGGMQCANTTDGYMSKTQFEQNGLSPITAGATTTTVNSSGTTITWVSGPKWSTDSSLVGTYIRLANTTSVFQVATVPSSTSLTTSVSTGTLTGVNMYWGDGMFANNCPGWRYEHSDFGGNGDDGILFVGSDTGRGSGQNMFVGNELGGNRAHDLEERGFGTAAQVAINNTYVGNVFLGSSDSVANTFSEMFMLDPSDDTITANVFRPAGRKFGVDFEESASGRAQRTTLVSNTFINGFGTGAFSANTALASDALAVFANAEGAGGPSTFGSGPTSVKFQGGIAQAGTGFMHFRGTSCATSAAVNGSCTSTITWPGTWNDTGYTATCALIAPTAAAGVGWLGAKTTTTLQVQIINLVGSASSATGEIDCIAVHD